MGKFRYVVNTETHIFQYKKERPEIYENRKS